MELEQQKKRRRGRRGGRGRNKVQHSSPVSVAKSAVRYVVHENPVDYFTVIRRRVAIEPSTCDQCGFDFCRKNGLPAFDDLDEGRKAMVLQAIEEHKRLAHDISTHHIVTEDELPKDWLNTDVESKMGAFGYQPSKRAAGFNDI